MTELRDELTELSPTRARQLVSIPTSTAVQTTAARKPPMELGHVPEPKARIEGRVAAAPAAANFVPILNPAPH